MTVPGNIDALLLGGQRGYQIERSLRFNSADSAYLNRTPASAGNRKTWTWSGWVKRSSLTTGQWLFGAGPVSTDYSIIRFGSGGSANDFLEYVRVVGSAIDAQKISSAVYRDTSAWYHIVVAEDAANTVARVYVNGSEISYSTNDNPSNVDGAVNNTGPHEIGRYVGTAIQHFSGYLTEINFIDGQALTPSSFGETDTITGVWKPKRYSGTYGTNGFYLKFADNSGTTSTTLGKDSSGNGNNWTPNNFSVTAGAGNDSLIDTPTPYADGGNGRANYPTWNPLTNGNVSVSNGSLDCTYASAAWQNIRSTMAMPASGKWYAEITQNSAATYWSVGICNGSFPNSYYGGQDANSWAWQNGNKFNNGSPTGYGSAGVSGDVFMIAVNRATNSIWLGKNGTWFSGDPAAGTTPMYSNLDASGDLFFMAAMYAGAAHIANFGQRAFSYTPPAGFSALNTQNLPEPSIKKPSSYMDVVTYTGNGSAQTISSLGFSPDFIWIKDRNTARSHYLANSIIGGNNYLSSDSTSQELTTTEGIKSIASNGFTLGYALLVNNTSETYVAWCWDESATPGFDIVTYTGNGATDRTVAHSLGVAPAFFIIKNRTTATDWPVYHKSLPSHDGGNYPTNSLRLNTTGALANTLGLWAAPTSTVITVSDAQLSAGNRPLVNTNGDNYVAYLWSEVAGFSKFGSYTGNGSSDGPFVYCGFRPRWIMIKRSDSAGSWYMIDTARATYNVVNPYVLANAANQEATDLSWDILSNGFKLRTSYGEINGSSGTFVFAAFSESAFKYSLAR